VSIDAEESPAAALATRYSLPRLGGRPPLRSYLRQLWSRRHFTVELSRSRFRAENEQDRLGVAWVVIKPLINAVVYGAIFGLLLPSDTRPDNFVPFLVAGVFVFQYFSSCLSDGAKSITGNLGLVRSLHFPRALLPVATVLQRAYGLVPMMAVLAVLVLATGEPLRVHWLQVPVALALMTLFNVGVAFVAGRLTIHVRDVAQLLPFITRLMFYTSGIFYSIEKVVSEPVLRAVLLANPVHVYISLVRGALLPDLPAPASSWWLGLGWGLGACLVGFIFFWAAEERYGRE
jgi:teichoic acid transport system permease protein